MLETFGLYVQNPYVISIISFTIIFILMAIIKNTMVSSIRKISKEKIYLADALDRIHWIFYFIVSIYISIQFIEIPEIVYNIVFYLFIITSVYYSVRVSQAIIGHFVDHIEDKIDDKGIVHAIRKVIDYTLWVFGFFIVITNFGYDITALIAGLGIGGIAVAFAMQNILSDVFSSIAIYLDKPFKVGDFIIVGNTIGTVRRIGIRSTRIASLTGEEIVMSNKALTDATISNFKKLEKRRINFSIGVVYGTPKAKLEKIPVIIQKIIDDTEDITFSRCHFKEFGDSSLNFETVLFVESGNYMKYVDAIQKVNFGIVSAFEKEKIEMAFPTQTIHLNK